MNSLIHSFTIFNQDPFGNGAERRSAQIKELLESNDTEWKKIPSGISPIKLSPSYIKRFLRVLTLNLKAIIILSLRPSIKRVIKNTWLYSHFEGIFTLKRNAKSNVILFENSKMEFYHILYYLKKNHYRIVGIPHNLESLVPLQKSGITNRMSPEWFMEEVKMLSECEHVFTISREETLLLKNFGIRASYLPYFPVKETYDFLIDVRKKRESGSIPRGKPKLILMLGSYVNNPTKEGINNRIKYFGNIIQHDLKIIIAGYGTEKIQPDTGKNGKSNIEIAGKLSDNQLSELLTKTDSILIHQGAASGALTRIQESLIAGVPVIANFSSSRNFFGTNGVYTYTTDEQMVEYLMADKPMPPIPEYPQREYKLFTEMMNELNET